MGTWMDRLKSVVGISKAEALIDKLEADGVEVFRFGELVCVTPAGHVHPEELHLIAELHPHLMTVLVIKDAKNRR